MKNVSGWLLEQLVGENGVNHAAMREFAPGELIFRAGDPGDYLAVLLSGSVEIRKNERVLSIVEPGSMFGEMGIIDHQKRVADAYSVSHSRIAEIREGQFKSMLQATPEFALAIMRLLTDRLRHRTES